MKLFLLSKVGGFSKSVGWNENQNGMNDDLTTIHVYAEMFEGVYFVVRTICFIAVRAQDESIVLRHSTYELMMGRVTERQTINIVSFSFFFVP